MPGKNSDPEKKAAPNEFAGILHGAGGNEQKKLNRVVNKREGGRKRSLVRRSFWINARKNVPKLRRSNLFFVYPGLAAWANLCSAKKSARGAGNWAHSGHKSLGI